MCKQWIHLSTNSRHIHTPHRKSYRIKNGRCEKNCDDANHISFKIKQIAFVSTRIIFTQSTLHFCLWSLTFFNNFSFFLLINNFKKNRRSFWWHFNQFAFDSVVSCVIRLKKKERRHSIIEIPFMRNFNFERKILILTATNENFST